MTIDWGHHQLDTVGQFLSLVAWAHKKRISLFRTERDRTLIPLLVHYLQAVRYWEHPDFGMWEEGPEVHSSSIGAVVAGLEALRREGLAVVPSELIVKGRETLDRLLPRESETRDVDMAQLSLVWPYKVVSQEMTETILSGIKEKLVQKNGVNRYWGDNYYRSHSGISGEWTFGFFWLSIVYSELGNRKEAEHWYYQGVSSMTAEGHIPELYSNGEPNEHTPLAWAHALALIAKKKLGKFSRVSAGIL